MNPKISIVVPIHEMKNGEFFLWRLVNSLTSQTFKDWELIITRDGLMAENTNSGIKRARGELIKILFLDDYFAHDNALRDIVEHFRFRWLITGTSTNPHPLWTDNIEIGNNRLGSPSALTILNDYPMLFDERMSWLLDCDYYRRMHDIWGKPDILEGVNVILGTGDHQMTNILTNEEKLAEHELMKIKHA